MSLKTITILLCVSLFATSLYAREKRLVEQPKAEVLAPVKEKMSIASAAAFGAAAGSLTATAGIVWAFASTSDNPVLATFYIFFGLGPIVVLPAIGALIGLAIHPGSLGFFPSLVVGLSAFALGIIGSIAGVFPLLFIAPDSFVIGESFNPRVYLLVGSFSVMTTLGASVGAFAAANEFALQE